MELGIRGKVALVTGSQGIGLAAAKALAAEGAHICVADVNAEQGRTAVSGLRETGASAMFVEGDISRESDVERMFSAAADELGPVDILVNNAGISPKAPFDQIPVEQFRKVMDVNLLGTYLCSRQAFRHMREKRWGRIINLASVAGLYGANVAGVHYAATKGGIISLTKTLARNMGPYQITVNCVAPARINTPMIRSVPDEVNQAFCQKIPLRRIGEPEEVAAVIAFLASVPAGYVSGACVDITGGYVG